MFFSGTLPTSQATPSPLWQAVPSLPLEKELFPGAISPRQAVPRLPWEITLFHWQRMRSPRQPVPRLPLKIALFHWQRVISPRQVPPLPQRMALSRQRVLHLPMQSGAQQGLGLGRQVPPYGGQHSLSVGQHCSPRGIPPGQCFPRSRVFPQYAQHHAGFIPLRGT